MPIFDPFDEPRTRHSDNVPKWAPVSRIARWTAGAGVAGIGASTLCLGLISLGLGPTVRLNADLASAGFLLGQCGVLSLMLSIGFWIYGQTPATSGPGNLRADRVSAAGLPLAAATPRDRAIAGLRRPTDSA